MLADGRRCRIRHKMQRFAFFLRLSKRYDLPRCPCGVIAPDALISYVLSLVNTKYEDEQTRQTAGTKAVVNVSRNHCGTFVETLLLFLIATVCFYLALVHVCKN